MNKQPLVSVIMPFYQQEDFLLDAVRSVEAQTYPQVELVIVDDCSPGATAEELVGWRQTNNLKIIRHDHNQGVSVARNTGVHQCSGELILPLDSDDLITEDYLEKTVAALTNEELGGVYTSVKLFGQSDWIWRPDCALPRHLSHGGPNTFLYRRQVFDEVGGYKPEIKYGEDCDFWLCALKKGWRFQHIDEALYLYRKHGGGSTDSEGHVCWKEATNMILREHRDLCLLYLEDLLANTAEKYAESVEEFRTTCDSFKTLQALNSQYEEQLHCCRAITPAPVNT